MSLYGNFGGMQIGAGINALNRDRYMRNRENINDLSRTAMDLVQQKAIYDEKEARKKSALDYLLGNGFSKEQAEQVSNTVGPEVVSQLMQRDWNKQDSEAARKAEFEDWLKKNEITAKQAAEDHQFGQLMSQIAVDKNHPDWGHSRNVMKQFNADVNALKKFVEENPRFADVFNLMNLDTPETGNGFLDEDILDKLKSVRGDVDASEAYLKELKDNGLLSQRVLGNPYFKDALDLLYQESGNDFNRLSPYLLLENTGKGDTAAGRQRKIDLEKFNNSVKAAKAALEKEAQKPSGEGKLPEGLTKAIVKEILKDPVAKRRYKMLGGQI